MTLTPTTSNKFRPSLAIQALGPEFYDAVKPADFPETTLRYRAGAAAEDTGLAALSDEDWIAHFGRFTPLKGGLQSPLALRYHGHQFQTYNPDIGDGRGFLYAQLYGADGRLLDLGTKGSGQTPYSRRGDGRLTLLGGVREVLATLYLGWLGVPTSRSFSLIETGEALTRGDEPSPARSSVLTRLSHSHIRFGTFQRLAYFGERDNLAALTSYCCEHYYPEETTPEGLLRACAVRSANTVASWMAGGFVHGVMNTDNMNITGESFDYGPYRFLPVLDSGFTAAYFDHSSLYAFARQPEVMYWNLSRLAQSLSLITDDKALLAALEAYAPAYRAALRDHVFRRLAITATDLETDISFVLETFAWLEENKIPWPQFWYDWQGGGSRENAALKSPNKNYYTGDRYKAWFKNLCAYDSAAQGPAAHGPEGDRPPQLLYEDIRALWSPIAEHDDWSAFNETVKRFTFHQN